MINFIVQSYKSNKITIENYTTTAITWRTCSTLHLIVQRNRYTVNSRGLTKLMYDMTKFCSKTKHILERTRCLRIDLTMTLSNAVYDYKTKTEYLPQLYTTNLFEEKFLMDYLTDFVLFHLRSLFNIFLKLSIVILSCIIMFKSIELRFAWYTETQFTSWFIDALAHYVNPWNGQWTSTTQFLTEYLVG